MNFILLSLRIRYHKVALNAKRIVQYQIKKLVLKSVVIKKANAETQLTINQALTLNYGPLLFINEVFCASFSSFLNKNTSLQC
jgi:hypothetical protein